MSTWPLVPNVKLAIPSHPPCFWAPLHPLRSEKLQGFGWLFCLVGLGVWGFLFLYISVVSIQGDWALYPFSQVLWVPTWAHPGALQMPWMFLDHKSQVVPDGGHDG